MSFDHEIATTNRTIDARWVPVHRRMPILPRYFGRHLIVAEATVYRSLESLCQDYSGGFWDFFELLNGGFYMAPCIDKRLRLQCAGNGFDGDMSADAAGIVACLMAFNTLLWQTREERFERLFYCLREFAGEHPEASAIFAAID
jgi:hypothetical protein